MSAEPGTRAEFHETKGLCGRFDSHDLLECHLVHRNSHLGRLVIHPAYDLRNWAGPAEADLGSLGPFALRIADLARINIESDDSHLGTLDKRQRQRQPHVTHSNHTDLEVPSRY